MMDIPIQPIIFSIPAIIYFFVQRRKGKSKTELSENLGLTISRLKYYGFGLLIAATTIGLTYLLLKFVTPDIFENENIGTNIYRNWTLTFGTIILAFLRETIYVTFGEELFFRGFLAGILIRKFGLTVGNILQALIFLLPHLLLLTINTDFWTYLIIIAIMGWILGLLRHKSKSIFPGLLTHSIVNTFAATLVMN